MGYLVTSGEKVESDIGEPEEVQVAEIQESKSLAELMNNLQSCGVVAVDPEAVWLKDPRAAGFMYRLGDGITEGISDWTKTPRGKQIDPHNPQDDIRPEMPGLLKFQP